MVGPKYALHPSQSRVRYEPSGPVGPFVPVGNADEDEVESLCSPHVDAGPLTHCLNEAAADSAMEVRLGPDEVEDVGTEVFPLYGVCQRVLTGLRSLPQACSVLGIVSSR